MPEIEAGNRGAAGSAGDAAARPDPVVPEGGRFEGVVLLLGPARIEGEVRGEVIAADALWIGEGASVEAPIEAGDLVVAGRVVGDVRATGRVEIAPTGRVQGEVSAGRLVLADGSFLEGACRTGASDDDPA